MLRNSSVWRNKNFPVILVVLVVALRFFPNIVDPSGSKYLLADGFDGNIAHIQTLVASGEIFSDNSTPIVQVGPSPGLPRVSFPSEFYGSIWLYKAFPAFTAYLVLKILVHSIAGIGLFLLLRDFSTKDRTEEFLSMGAAICFALVPHWSSGMLSIAGLPLIAWSLLMIRSGERHWKYFVPIIIWPFFSLLVMTGVFVFLIAGCLVLWDAIKKKELNPLFLASLGGLATVSLLVEYRFFYEALISKSFIPHRVEFDLSGYDFSKSMDRTIGYLLRGRTRVEGPSFHHVVPFIVAAAFASGALRKKINKPLVGIVLAAVVVNLIYGIWYWNDFIEWRNQIPGASAINFSRARWLLPPLAYLAMGVGLIDIKRNIGRLWWIGFFAVVMQIAVLFHFNFVSHYFKRYSFDEFFGPITYGMIDRAIERDKKTYSIANIGLLPTIAQYNGFQTFDFYASYYPLEYKKLLRPIIEGELDRNEDLAQNFDGWGNRFYLFSDEIGQITGRSYNIRKPLKNAVKLEKLSIDFNALKKLGVEYIFSAAAIANPQVLSLTFINRFQHESSPWIVYLYKIN